jgi:hypothetical protein
VSAVKKQSNTVFIQLLGPQNAGIYFHKFFDRDLQVMLEKMDGNIYENLVMHIKFDKIKGIFVIPKDSVNFIFDKLEPFCRKKRINLVGIPEFVFKIIEHPVYKIKAQK